ncbi:MAG: hypothetical protein ACI37Q_00565 [Candidatus Gastranaerophilaceae bacterium]
MDKLNIVVGAGFSGATIANLRISQLNINLFDTHQNSNKVFELFKERI